MGKQRRSFSEEFKRDAIDRLAVGGRPLAQVARELDINPSILQTWRRKYRSREREEAVPKTAFSLEEENRRLRHENAALREDREILKKAAAFFAKESR